MSTKGLTFTFVVPEPPGTPPGLSLHGKMLRQQASMAAAHAATVPSTMRWNYPESEVCTVVKNNGDNTFDLCNGSGQLMSRVPAIFPNARKYIQKGYTVQVRYYDVNRQRPYIKYMSPYQKVPALVSLQDWLHWGFNYVASRNNQAVIPLRKMVPQQVANKALGAFLRTSSKKAYLLGQDLPDFDKPDTIGYWKIYELDAALADPSHPEAATKEVFAFNINFRLHYSSGDNAWQNVPYHFDLEVTDSIYAYVGWGAMGSLGLGGGVGDNSGGPECPIIGEGSDCATPGHPPL